MKNNLLNNGYENKFRITHSKGQYLFSRKEKFLDLSMSAGVLLLGHSSKVFNKAINDLKKIGSLFITPNIYTDKYSLILKKIFPNFSKFVISNSGAEANIRAIRIARAITKKDKIAMVSGSWHGSVDTLLFDIKNNIKKELSDGIPKSYKNDLIILPYNNYEKTYKILKKNKNKIALLIIEPIQQYIPTLHSEDYIKKIFNFCKKNKIIICFDEMLTGMRSEKFSVQNNLKLKPDMSTFGKIIGGGIPIGVTALSKNIEYKVKEKSIFFGGTYSANPFASYVGLETLKYILKNKNEIYKKINKLTFLFVNSLNNYFKMNKIRIRVYNYNSMCRLVFTDKIILNRSERDNSEKKIKKKIINFHKYLKKNRI